MKLYRARVPSIATAVIDTLANDGDIEVEATQRAEAVADLVAIMENYLQRDHALSDAVRAKMDAENLPWDARSKARQDVATEWNHPTGREVEFFLSNQFVENFMISRFVEEVFTDDRTLKAKVRTIVKGFDVDESALRAEAEERIKNINKGSVEYQDALSRALKEVKKRHGLV